MSESPQGVKLRVKELEELSKINPSDPWPHFMLGEVYSTLDAKKALEEYDKAIKLDPHVVDFHYKKALLLFKEGRANEALECLERASVIDYKNSPIYHYLKGTLLDEMGEYEKAIKEYEKALEKDPNNTWILEAKLLDMVEVGLVTEALKEIDDALKVKGSEGLVRLKEEIIRAYGGARSARGT